MGQGGLPRCRWFGRRPQRQPQRQATLAFPSRKAKCLEMQRTTGVQHTVIRKPLILCYISHIGGGEHPPNVTGKISCGAWPAPAREGCQGAEAAPCERGITVPLICQKSFCPETWDKLCSRAQWVWLGPSRCCRVNKPAALRASPELPLAHGRLCETLQRVRQQLFVNTIAKIQQHLCQLPLAKLPLCPNGAECTFIKDEIHNATYAKWLGSQGRAGREGEGRGGTGRIIACLSAWRFRGQG